ncbi:MBL fold metallo-hydrolase [Paenibacillus sp. MWE-103]|uniref:MBL fold metallo-hydrolase n=1 Tax=Paenibacillus artemisiicola TaxID=1172618 RepID=A0ABS3WKC0_9BACL|nr:MBL fold metallo-hydrolase [Paenibacillus artemisiicola]MBO7748774.1 MBL fold metallo-hydrolase [Paenibacillus artemisiicola]
MTELLFLGTSAGVSTANRHHCSMAIKRNGRLYLIDCGCPASMLLKKMGEDPKAIDAVFLTHWHPDHASGLPMLIQDLQLTYKPETLPIYGPAGTVRKVGQLQRMFIIPQDIYPFQLESHEYDESFVFERDGLRIEFFQTMHLNNENWRKIDERHGHEIAPVAYGMVLHLDGKKIVVSGDVLSSGDIVRALPDADLVIHEFGHIHPEKLNAFVKEQGIANLLITHIHHEWDLRADELKRIVSAGHAGDVQVAHDLMRLAI